MDEAGILVHADVGLHFVVQLVPLPGLVHLWIHT